MKKALLLLGFVLVLSACQAGLQNHTSSSSPQSLPQLASSNEESEQVEMSAKEENQISKPMSYQDYFSIERSFDFNRTALDHGDFDCSLDETGMLHVKNKKTSETITPISDKVEQIYRYGDTLYVQTQMGIVKYNLVNGDSEEIYSGEISPVGTLSPSGDIIPLDGFTSLYINTDVAFFMREKSVYRYHIPSQTEEVIYEDSKIIDFEPLSNMEILVTRLNPEWEKCVAEIGNTESGIPEFEQIKYNTLTEKVIPYDVQDEPEDQIEFNDLDTLSETQSSDISSDNIIKVESIKINFVSYTDETRTLEVTDQTIIKTILNYILSMEQSDYYGGPGSGGGIEVIISKDGTEHVYVFKSDGLIKDLKNPDKRVWYQSTEGAYDYLKSFFDL